MRPENWAFFFHKPLDTSPPTLTARKISFRMSYMLPPMTDITIAPIKQIRSCYIVISSMHAICLFPRVLIAMTCLPVSPPTCCFYFSRGKIIMRNDGNMNEPYGTIDTKDTHITSSQGPRATVDYHLLY